MVCTVCIWYVGKVRHWTYNALSQKNLFQKNRLDTRQAIVWFYKTSYFEQVLKVWSAANGFLLVFSEFIRGQTSSRLRADVLMKGTIVCNPSFVILKGRLGMRILKLVSRVEQVNMVTIMKLVNPGNLVNMFFCRERMQSSMVRLVTLAPGGTRLLSTSSRLDRWIVFANGWKL